jgi:hypothetical protein
MGLDLYNHFGIHPFQDLVLERCADIRIECSLPAAGREFRMQNAGIMVSGIRFVIE